MESPEPGIAGAFGGRAFGTREFVVAGDTDDGIGTGADRVVAALHRWTEFRVLRDAAETIDCDGAPLHVIGLDDRGREDVRSGVLEVV